MSTLKVDTITDVAGSLPPVFPAGSAQLNPLANREDKIINGDFGIWQRSVSSAGVGFVAADRWCNNLTGGTVTQSRQAFALGDTLGVTQPTYFLRQTVSGQTLATQYANTYHSIEGVRSYAGQTITVLGWARRSSGTGNMCVEGEQSFGTGGGGISSPVTSISPTTVNLGVTGTWAPFAVVMAVPTVFGKTLGTDGNDRFLISFWTSAGSNWNARSNSLGLQTIGVDLWGIHIRQGTWTAAATADYRPRDPGTELALCQRYYEVINGQATGTAYAATSIDGAMSFAVTKRAVPAMALVGHGAWFAANVQGTLTSTAFVGTTVASYGFGCGTFTGTVTAGWGVVIRGFTHTADAEL